MRMRNGRIAPPTFLHHMIPPTNMRKMSTELFSACEAGDLDRVRRVIAAGVNPRKAIGKGNFEETPLHTACRYVPSSSVHVSPRNCIPCMTDEEVSACSTHMIQSSVLCIYDSRQRGVYTISNTCPSVVYYHKFSKGKRFMVSAQKHFFWRNSCAFVYICYELRRENFLRC